MTAPLSGLRVIDLSATLPGAQATQFLADAGADVILIGRPGGSPLRADPGWPGLLRGKRSVALDLHADDDQTTLDGLLAKADVLVTTLRPAAAARLGLTADRLAARCPRLVAALITGWGSRGPWAGYKGYEALIMAKTGVLHSKRQLTPGPDPAYVSVPYASFAAAQTAVHGILAALIEPGPPPSPRSWDIMLARVAERTLAEWEGVFDRNPNVFGEQFRTPDEALAHPQLVHDGRVVTVDDPDLGPVRQPSTLVHAGRRPLTEIRRAPRLDEHAAEIRSQIPLDRTDRPASPSARRACPLAGVTVLELGQRRRPDVGARGYLRDPGHKDAWGAELTARDVGCVAVAQENAEWRMQDDEFYRAGYAVDAVSPIFDAHRRPAPLVRFSRSATKAHAGCRLGQHTDALLRELGYDDERIARLRKRDVVR